MSTETEYDEIIARVRSDACGVVLGDDVRHHRVRVREVEPAGGA